MTTNAVAPAAIQTIVVSLGGLLDRLLRPSQDPKHLQLSQVEEGLFALNFSKAEVYANEPPFKLLSAAHNYDGSPEQKQLIDDLRLALVVADAEGRSVWLKDGPHIEYQQVSDLLVRHDLSALPSSGYDPGVYKVSLIASLIEKTTNLQVIY